MTRLTFWVIMSNILIYVNIFISFAIALLIFYFLFNLDGVPKEGLRVDDVLVRLANINLIEEKVCHACICLLFL